MMRNCASQSHKASQDAIVKHAILAEIEEERVVAREFKSDDLPDLYTGTAPLAASKSINFDCSKPQGNILILYTSTVQRFLLVRSPVEDSMGANAGKLVW